MAGYSGTPLDRKLGIKPGHRVLLRGAPDDLAALLAGLAKEAKFVNAARSPGTIDVQLVFVRKLAALAPAFEKARGLMTTDGAVWLCWPKKSSGIATDVTDTSVRGTGLASGLVDNKVCAVDETWSGLRFVIRLKDRAKAKG